MGRPKINDGLNNWQRHRLRNVTKYRNKKAEYAKTPEERTKRTAYMRKWREENRERHNSLARDSHQRNKHKHIGKQRNCYLKRKFGLTSQEFERLLEKQKNCCAICEKHKSREGRTFHVDHCHKTGKVRGILCCNCNTILGFYETRLEKLKDKILEYLK